MLLIQKLFASEVSLVDPGRKMLLIWWLLASGSFPSRPKATIIKMLLIWRLLVRGSLVDQGVKCFWVAFGLSGAKSRQIKMHFTHSKGTRGSPERPEAKSHQIKMHFTFGKAFGLWGLDRSSPERPKAY